MDITEQTANNLRDIHLPDAISWWPPAIGWWILLALIIIAFVFIPKLYRRMTYTPLNKVAHITFQNIVTDYKNNNDESAFVIETSKFLRQIVMSYCGREEIAQLTGDKWIQTLNSITEQDYFSSEIKQTLLNAPYQKSISIDAEQLINSVQNWLNQLPKQAKGLNK